MKQLVPQYLLPAPFGITPRDMAAEPTPHEAIQLVETPSLACASASASGRGSHPGGLDEVSLGHAPILFHRADGHIRDRLPRWTSPLPARARPPASPSPRSLFASAQCLPQALHRRPSRDDGCHSCYLGYSGVSVHTPTPGRTYHLLDRCAPRRTPAGLRTRSPWPHSGCAEQECGSRDPRARDDCEASRG